MYILLHYNIIKIFMYNYESNAVSFHTKMKQYNIIRKPYNSIDNYN